jgi:hypothetical protein
MSGIHLFPEDLFDIDLAVLAQAAAVGPDEFGLLCAVGTDGCHCAIRGAAINRYFTEIYISDMQCKNI